MQQRAFPRDFTQKDRYPLLKKHFLLVTSFQNGIIFEARLSPFAGGNQKQRERNTMNKKTALIGILACASFAMAIDAMHWNAEIDAGLGRVTLSTDDGTDKSGYWYDYSDKDNSGTSAFTWPSDVSANTYGNFYGPLVEAYGGIKGIAVLSTGYDYPFLGIGFNLVNEAQDGADISGWEGMCITYTSTKAFYYELGTQNEKETTEYNNYKVTIPAATTKATGNYAWTSFKQESGWGKTLAQATALTQIAAIKLKFSGTAGTSIDFLISEIGSYGQCKGTDAIKGAKAASSVKAQLAGRTLNLSGFTSAASVEVINLQGQIVVKSMVNGAAALNLAKLDRGVYMVRVSGKTFNMNQKIVLN